MLFEKIKFNTEQERVRQIWLFNYMILEYYTKHKEKKKHYSVLPLLKKTCMQPIKNKEVFYLKINSDKDYSFRCLQHWINIINYYEGDFYIVCDDLRIKKNIYNTINFANKNIKFISSREQKLKNYVNNIATDKWYNATYAQLITFYHSRKYNIQRFWNIDADDTMLCLCADEVAKILKNISNYAIINNVDAFSLDMHRSRTKGKHWSFGITYIQNKVDWFELLPKDNSWIKKYEQYDYSFNLDWYFTNLKDHNLANIQTFFIENMLFVHFGEFLFNPIYANVCIFRKDIFEFPILHDILGTKKYGKIKVFDDVIPVCKVEDIERCYYFMQNFQTPLMVETKMKKNMWG